MLPLHEEEGYKDRTLLQENLLWDCGSVEACVLSSIKVHTTKWKITQMFGREGL